MAIAKHILLVDDDAEAMHLLQVILKRNDYTVSTATNGLEAIEIIKQEAENIDVIILDLIMPGDFDGYAVCTWLQKADKQIQDIPVIVLSAMSTPQEMARSYTVGAFQHITKPYDLHHLLAVVESMVRLKKVQDNAVATAEKFKAIFDNSPLGILVISKNYEVLEMSRTLRTRYPGAIPGSGIKFFEFFYEPPRTEPHPEMPLSETLNSGKIQQKMVKITAEKVYFWNIVAAPLTDKRGQINGAVMVLEDVTQKQNTEQQLLKEIEHARKAEERLRETLIRMDNFAFTLMQTKKDLQKKTSELEELNQKLKVISITDELTGLFNHRHCKKTLSFEVNRNLRYNHELSLMMIDIDNFKNVNDTHGHQAGDAILRQLAHIMRTQLRETDILARYGGEEFIVILPETPNKIAMHIAERIRKGVSEGIFTHEILQLGISISIGVTTSNDQKITEESLLKNADIALYKAKATGKNKVINGENLTADGSFQI